MYAKCSLRVFAVEAQIFLVTRMPLERPLHTAGLAQSLTWAQNLATELTANPDASLIATVLSSDFAFDVLVANPHLMV